MKFYFAIVITMILTMIWSCTTPSSTINKYLTNIPSGKYFKTEIKRKEVYRQSENMTVSYTLPNINVTGKTKQSQVKGGVTITTEIIPFEVSRMEKIERKVSHKDSNQPDFDNYEIAHTPFYEVTPKNISFKIRIRNNEEVPLKLSEIGFAIIIDGTQWSFPTGYLDDWNKGMVLTGFEKEYIVRGPQLDGLYSAQLVYILLNGVPTSYNQSGNITKKSNFEWYFQCKSELVQKNDQKTYTYETKPIHKEQCAKCNGTGTDPQAYQCGTCKGSGRVASIFSDKIYACVSCNGTGRARPQKCPNCMGGGQISYPKSVAAPIESEKMWYGWPVNIATIPTGATVSIIQDTQTGIYTDLGWSNISAKPYLKSRNISETNEYFHPILIKYQGKSVKVMPYDENGKELSNIVVDFSTGTPIVKEGKEVE